MIQRPTRSPPWASGITTYGITGTNGKTSSTYLLSSVLRASGASVLRQCTTGSSFNDEPWARDKKGFACFLDHLERAAKLGAAYLVAEATSKALEQGYAAHWRFDHALFTNLSPDHLTTHGTYEQYLAAKAQLFVHLGPGHAAVFNAADEHALFVEQVTPPDVRRFFFHAPSRGAALRAPDLAAAAVESDLSGSRVTLEAGAWSDALGGELEIRLVGGVFAENALGVAALALATDVDAGAVKSGLGKCAGVPGRFEVAAREPDVAVDYAHTEDALERTLTTAREVAAGRVIVVFGAGGDRMKEKRAPLGRAAARRADVAIVTNDNPRSEDPATIAQQVVQGFEGSETPVQTVLDRRAAIAHALEMWKPGDLVVVAGKGHETGQTIGSETLPFSDVAVVRELVGG